MRACLSHYGLLATVAMLLVLLWATPDDSLKQTGATRALPPIGVYEGCSPSTSQCRDRLDTLRTAGFTAVLNYSMLYASEAELKLYLDRADALGIKIIWPLHHPVLRRGTYNGRNIAEVYARMQPTCACDTWQELVDYATNIAKQHSSTYLYYVGDEIAVEEHDAAKAIADRIKQADPATPRLFVSNERAGSDVKNLRPFTDMADVLAADIYPIGLAGSSPSNVGGVASDLQRFADSEKKPSALVLQSFAWSQYSHTDSWAGDKHFPTHAEMREMRNWALSEARPSLILWYSYYNLLQYTNPEAHFADLVSASFDQDLRKRGLNGHQVPPSSLPQDYGSLFIT